MSGRPLLAATTVLFCLCTAFADLQHKVTSGQCLESIAERYGVEVSALERTNGLSRHGVLPIGKVLTIPTSTPKTEGSYAVREGDNDWRIAGRLGTTIEALHAANPSARWTRLQIGQKLAVPGSKAAPAAVRAAIVELPKLRPETKAKVFEVRELTYTVREGDNDWKIADSLALRLQDLHKLNPNVRFAELKPGMTLRILPRGRRLPERILDMPKLEEPIETPINTRWAMLAADRVGVRAAPSVTGSRLTLVDRGTPAKVVSRSGNWYRLEFQRGTVGWVRGDLLEELDQPGWSALSSSSSRGSRRSSGSSRVRSRSNDSRYLSGSASDIVEFASQYRGVRYRWGGESPRGFDCSGFTKYVYENSKSISLPHNAASQYGQGRSVSKSEIKPGDLVFFRSRSGGSRIGHAGIAVGGGRFIHASSGGGRVQVDTYESGHYAGRFAGARTFRSGSGEKKEEAAPTEEKDAAKKDAAKKDAAKKDE